MNIKSLRGLRRWLLQRVCSVYILGLLFSFRIMLTIHILWHTLVVIVISLNFSIENRKKNLLSSNTSSTWPHNTVNFGPLAAEIGSGVWGTPANFNGFRGLASFFPIVDTCLSCEVIARQSCEMVPRWRFLATFCVLYFSEPRAARFRPAF